MRAGAITPQLADEVQLRTSIGLPTASAEVLQAWKDDGGVRRPITLLQEDPVEPAAEE